MPLVVALVLERLDLIRLEFGHVFKAIRVSRDHRAPPEERRVLL